MAIELTKDADALICVVYKSYLEKRKNDVSKTKAKMLGGASDIQTLLPKWSVEDIADTCWELHSHQLLQCQPGDGTVYFAALTNAGIFYMENRFPDGVRQIVEFLQTIKEINPFN